MPVVSIGPGIVPRMTLSCSIVSSTDSCSVYMVPFHKGVNQFKEKLIIRNKQQAETPPKEKSE